MEGVPLDVDQLDLALI